MTVPLEITVILQRVLDELDDISLPSLGGEEEDDEYWFVDNEARDNERRISGALIATPDVPVPAPLTLSRWKSCDALSSRAMPNPRLHGRQGPSQNKSSDDVPTPNAIWDTSNNQQNKNSLLRLAAEGAELQRKQQHEDQEDDECTCAAGDDTAAAVILTPPIKKPTTSSGPPRLPKRTWQSKKQGVANKAA